MIYLIVNELDEPVRIGQQIIVRTVYNSKRFGTVSQ